MAALAARPGSPLAKLINSRRAGTWIMLGGLVLAGVAWFLVTSTVRQAREASLQASSQRVAQVYAVMATRDIAESTPIRAEDVAVRAFPAAFAPAGVVSSVDAVVGKFATTNIVKDQMVLSSQVSVTRRSSNLSASIPPGKVAFWMPMPDLLAQSGGVQAGDHLDILLSIGLVAPGDKGTTAGIATQDTLQNVEVFFIGSALAADVPSAPPPGTAPAAGGSGLQPVRASGGAARVMAFLVDPQDALLLKFVKDSGGNIDLVLRSRDSHDPVDTEAVTADTLVDRFKFRVPDRWTVGGR